jgi:predicted phage terminase large subunit-like protein
MPQSSQTILWSPTQAQALFLSSPADEALYGGAAGGGKSAAVVALPLRWVDNPRFNALVLRRDTTQLRDLISKTEALYPALGAKLNLTTGTWRFPSGARVWFTHCEHETDVSRFDGQEFHLVVFDELTHFTEKQYRAIRARIRGTDPTLPRATRATTNPGGPGHEWVFARFAAWLDPKHPRPSESGRLRWYTGDDEVARGTPDALSRTFVPARLEDNPHVTPEYRAALLQLDPLRRAQLLSGDWLARPAAGLYFKRDWFRAGRLGERITRCRYWDRAASPTGDWTVGLRMASDGTAFLIEDVERLRGTPSQVQTRIRGIAETEPDVTQVLEQDPGQAGVAEVDAYARLLRGLPFRFVRPTGDKVTRALPASAQAEAGKIYCAEGAWRTTLFGELEAFPEGGHDDQVDALSGAVNFLAGRSGVVTTPRLVGNADRGAGW